MKSEWLTSEAWKWRIQFSSINFKASPSRDLWVPSQELFELWIVLVESRCLASLRPWYRLPGSHDGRMRAAAWLRRDPELRRASTRSLLQHFDLQSWLGNGIWVSLPCFASLPCRAAVCSALYLYELAKLIYSHLYFCDFRGRCRGVWGRGDLFYVICNLFPRFAAAWS